MNRLSKFSIAVFAAFVCFAGHAAAQATDCPADKVCITREAALKAVADADAVIALKKEIAVKDQAFADQKDLLNKMRIDFAEVSGENTALKQNDVSNRAIIEILLKNAKAKKIGLIVL